MSHHPFGRRARLALEHAARVAHRTMFCGVCGAGLPAWWRGLEGRRCPECGEWARIIERAHASRKARESWGTLIRGGGEL